MALQSTPELLWDSIEANWNIRGDQVSNRAYRCYYDPLDNESTVFAGLPGGMSPRTPDPVISSYIVTQVGIRAGKLCTHPKLNIASRQWFVSVEYGPWTSLLNSPDGNPINEPPDFYTRATQNTRIISIDLDGNPIANTVGDPYDPVPEIMDVSHTLIIEQNIQNPNVYSILKDFSFHLNVNDWKTFPARTLLLGPVSIPKRAFYQAGNFVYYPFIWELLYEPLTWDLILANQGYREYDTSQSTTGNYTVINQDGSTSTYPAYPVRDILVNNEPTRESCMLSAAGKYLPPPVTVSNLVLNRHKVYKPLDFATLPFNSVVIPTGS